MEKSGFMLNEDRFLSSLASSERLKQEAEKICPERKAYSEILRVITKDFSTAMKDKDYASLFELEKLAQEHDAIYHSVDKEKTLQTFAAMDMLKQQFMDCSDPEKARSRFIPNIERLNMQGVRMKDKAFDATANSICGFINSFKSARCVPAENGFYSIRSDAITAIQKEHQRHIDQALGFETKERGLSR